MFRTLWPLAMLAAVLAASTTLSTTLARAHEIVGNRSFRQRSPTIPASTTRCRCRPFRYRKPATFRPSSNLTSQVSFKTHHRGFRRLVCTDMVAALRARWTKPDRGPRLPEPRDDIQISPIQSPEHEFVMSAGLEINGAAAALECRRRTLHCLHTHDLLRQGFGDLPTSMNWARPFAITGQFGYAIPGVSKTTSGTSTPTPGDGHRHRI
jgi:hypothetical protein